MNTCLQCGYCYQTKKDIISLLLIIGHNVQFKNNIKPKVIKNAKSKEKSTLSDTHNHTTVPRLGCKYTINKTNIYNI